MTHTADNISFLDRSSWHELEPNYDRPIFELPEHLELRILGRLTDLYGENEGAKCLKELDRILKVYYAHKSESMIGWEKNFHEQDRLTEKHVILATYGDLVYSPKRRPLETLAELCRKYLKSVFNTLHILPFYPYSSDRGFAVVDFEEVDPRLGSWEDILSLRKDFLLMFDGVFNHVSAKSRWFQEYLNGNPEYQHFFTEFSTREKISEDHLKLIVRPRTSNILSHFSTLKGPRLVWTTFSEDQIDLNYHNPKVLLRMVEILLTYVRRGADFIRLDAVTYLWEELGTTCVHLNQSHTTIKLFRDVLDAVAPHVALITETNVAHEDNIRYFGNGEDEAQMVYNFALPPLVLHAFQTGNASLLTEWAASLEKVSETATYLNFLDSHDGIGLMAVRDILSREEIEQMTLRIVEHGGFISHYAEGDGTERPYELNITWYSALNREDADETTEFQVRRYLASRAIAFVLMGVPGIYLHGLLGSKNDADAVLEESQKRSINRRTINEDELIKNLQDESTSTHLIFHRLVHMIQKRSSDKAFHPNSPQRVLNVSDALFTLLRTALDGSSHVLAITNVTPSQQAFALPSQEIDLKVELWRDLLSGRRFSSKDGRLSITVSPYEVLWLKPA